MANTNNKLISVPLNGPLNFNKLKTPVQNFNGYNDINSPLYGGAISPVYKSKEQKYGRYIIKKNKITGEIDVTNPDIDETIGLYINNVLKEETLHFSQNKSIEKDIILVRDAKHYVYNTGFEDPSQGVYSTTKIINNDESFLIHSEKRPHFQYLRNGYLIAIYKISIDSPLPQAGKICIQSISPTNETKKAYISDELENFGVNILDTTQILSENPKIEKEIFISIYEKSKINNRKTIIKEDFKDTFVFGKENEMNSKTVLFNIINGSIKDVSLLEDSSKINSLFYFKSYIVPNIAIESTDIYYSRGISIRNPIPSEGNNLCINSLKKNELGKYTFDEALLAIPEYFSLSLSSDKKNFELVIAYNEFFTMNILNQPAVEKELAISLDEAFLDEDSPNAFWISYAGKCMTCQRGIISMNCFSKQMINYKIPLYINTDYIIGGFSFYYTSTSKIYNNGILSALSLNGTLLTLNGALDTFTKITENNNEIYFKSSKGDWKKITLISSFDLTDEELKDYYFYIDDFLVFRAAENINCIDSNMNTYRVGNDWNNRITISNSNYSPYITENAKNEKSALFSSGVNLNFAATDKKLSSMNVNPAGLRIDLGNNENRTIDLSNFDIDFYGIDNYNDIPYKIDFYACESPSITPEYLTSIYKRFLEQKDENLIGMLLPTEATIIPTPLSIFQNTNFNQIIISQDQDFFTLINTNATNYFSASVSSLLDKIKNMFLIQGQTFAITNDYIIPATYNSPLYSLDQATVKITGLKYCGALPTMAIFYSPLDKTLRQFTADSNLSILTQATEINDIYRVIYNEQTQSIYLCTNNGIYVYTIDSQFRIPITDVRDIYFKDDLAYIETTNESYAYTLTPKEGFDKIPVKFTTRYYGQPNNMVSNIDCIYIRLYNEEDDPDSNFKIRVKTLNQGIFTTEEKTIKLLPGDWDKESHTALIKYQPQYQKCMAMEAQVETDNAISEIIFSNSQAESFAQAKPNLNI